MSERTNVYNKDGCLLGHIEGASFIPVPKEPTFNEKFHQRTQHKRVWDQGRWVELTETRPPVSGVVIPYAVQYGDYQFQSPNVGPGHYLITDNTEQTEEFFSSLEFLFDDDKDDDASVGCVWDDGVKFWKEAEVDKDYSRNQMEPNSDCQKFWCLTPSNVRLLQGQFYGQGHAITYEQAEANLEEFPTPTNVSEMWKAFGGKDRSLPFVAWKYYRIEKGTENLITKIAYFAEDGWVFRSWDGESFFVKEA